MKKTIYFTVALMFVFTISRAQTIPNAGFESWTSMGSYNNPDSWSCLNSITAPMSTYTCMKGTPGKMGAAYLNLTSKTVSGIGVVPGVAVSGLIDQTTMKAKSGFAYNSRPLNLTGSWQHMIYGSTQGFIDVLLTRWDATAKTRVTVASAHNVLSGMAMSWAAFTIPLTYVDSNNPDSCIITLSASGTNPTANDYLWVDNLGFSGTVSGVSTLNFNGNVTLFPNPSSENIGIDLSSLNDKILMLRIYDVQGKLIKEIQSPEASSNLSLNISDLSKGNYILTVITGVGIINKKFIKE